MMRTRAFPALVVVVSLAAIAAILALDRSANHSRDARLELANVRIELNRLQNVPFQASPTTGGSPEEAARRMRDGKRAIRSALGRLRADSPPAELGEVGGPLRDNFGALDRIYAIGASGREYGRDADRIAGEAGRSAAAITDLLLTAGREYQARARRAEAEAMFGTVLVILLLVGAFAFLYRRATRATARAESLAEENERLLAASREEAITDALTGLRNRRALIKDLQAELESGVEPRRLLLALFDLNGFKQYNDTFGHPAGDALLTRLGKALAGAVAGRGTAYRMGGDEFCLLAPDEDEAGRDLARIAAMALSESGDVFEIGCSYGVTHIPVEATSAPDALRLADQRMYEHKAGRSSASRQSTDVLLQVLSERSIVLDRGPADVTALAGLTAEALGTPEPEIKRIQLAAELHDVGKAAIPDTILGKTGKLDEREWDFMRRHTIMGERIVRAAPSLANTADLVRSSHERWDGGGYPDGLSGEDIPLGARIISVCDAYDAMVSGRPYKAAVPPAEALAELRRCAGTQFDPRVVERFCELAAERERAAVEVG